MVISTTSKTCYKCNTVYPLNEFIKGTNTCKSCKREQNLIYRLKNRLSLKEIPIKKFCSSCRTVKASHEFYKSTSNCDGLQYYCKACIKVLNDEKSKKKCKEPGTKVKNKSNKSCLIDGELQ